jgi:DNA (cytosine-5)-methyltransferase 1
MLDLYNVTELERLASGWSRPPSTVLSLFPGIDLLGKGFEEEAFCVLRGPDPIFGGSIESFFPWPKQFCGIIAGPPCQDFSRARRCPPTGNGNRMIGELARCIGDAKPDWWLVENVAGVPDVEITGYRVQRFFLNARDCGCVQHRHRYFQFGSLDGVGVVFDQLPPAAKTRERCCLASEGSRTKRRSWADFCELQGLPRDFDLPGWTLSAKYRAVGNGVPIPMARVLAIAIKRRHVTMLMRVCVCGCGRVPPANGSHASAACRKRMERRRRDCAGVTGPG